MRLRLFSLGSTISVLLMLLFCRSYSPADNVLSGSGNLVINTVWVNLNGGSANIANFGPDSLNGSLSFSNTYTNYQETHGFGAVINYSAALMGGPIQLSLAGAGQSYILNGLIVSGSLSGYYCLSPYSPGCGPWGGAQQTAFDFSGIWDNGWQADGSVFVWSHAWHPGYGNYAVATQPSGSDTPEPNSLVLLASGALGLIAMAYRRLTL